MKFLLSIALAFLAVSNVAFGEVKTHKVSEWCSVTCPTAVKIGEKFTCKVKLTGADTSMFIKSDLHGFKADNGYGGWNASGGKQQQITNDAEISFTYTANAKDDLKFVKALFYISPNGNYGNATKKTWTPVINIVTQ